MIQRCRNSTQLIFVLSQSKRTAWRSLLLLIIFFCYTIKADTCPPSDAILPCRCSLRNKEIQIWCSHSNLPQVMDGIKAVEKSIKAPIDELVLENNQLPALPGRFFGSMQVVRLMLRYNSLERVSNGWLAELENSLVEIYIVEPLLRSIPVESLNGLINLIAITIQSDELKHLPDFSELLSLSYLSVQSKSITELQSKWFQNLPKIQNIHINGGSNLNRLEIGLLDSLMSLENVDLSRNAISWIHLRAFYRLPNLINLKLSENKLSDLGMIGRTIKDLENLKKLRLDHNAVNIIEEGSFVDLAHLTEIHLNNNRITEIQYGAFHRTPMLRLIYLHNNRINRVHPESFLQSSGGGVESVYIQNNEIDNVRVLRSLLDALPALKFLDMSNNFLANIRFGTLRGHGTIEQLHLNNNQLKSIDRDALMAMPALRELRLRNNSLSNQLQMPFWNLPGLKGLDLSQNQFRKINSFLLAGLPSLRRLDLSENSLASIDSETFHHSPMLETLNISVNELNFLHSTTFLNLDRLFEIDASYNRLTEMLVGLPKIVERVSMRGNFISKLSPSSGIGKSLNLPNLRMFDLSQNKLEHIPKYAFQGLPQLRVLILSNNHLRNLEDTTFWGLNRLELLHLQENQITRLDDRTFLAMSELRNLNLQGNRLESITDNIFSNNTQLEQLDLSRNAIRYISPVSFESQKSLEYLDLSSNLLTDLSVSLANLLNLHDIDLSYNQIGHLQADVISAWRNVIEIRLSNNMIADLKHGTFRNLPKLQYLDLSSNEISTIEPGAFKNLPELRELVLADNKLIELKDHVFENLPNVLAAHFQYNQLKYISPESFYHSPSLVFFNLSNNYFRNMDNIGLRSMRNLEVLDLSNNHVKIITTMPLKALNWLVELNIDNNHICKIQGSPFEAMPRLRVLSMKNNRLRIIREKTFENLRSNIAILDVDGNPIVCSCEMQWLSVWLQETNFPYPGPTCQDGRLLRASRMEKSLCLGENEFGYGTDQRSTTNHLPLINEHGDIFTRQLNDELNDECDEPFPSNPAAVSTVEKEDDLKKQPPLAGESEYFYDQFIDYVPQQNETGEKNDRPTISPDPTTPPVIDLDNVKRNPLLPSDIDLNETILQTNFFNRRPPPPFSQQSQSPFTFFGYPIPSFSGIGRIFDGEKRSRKVYDDLRRNYSPISRSTNQYRNRLREFNSPGVDFEKYLSEESLRNNDNRRRIESSSDETINTDEQNIFRTTSFREPTSVEHGGFKPMIPKSSSGFVPIDPNSKVVETTENPDENNIRNLIPVVTETPKKHFIRSTSIRSPVTEMELMTTPKADTTTENMIEETTEFPIDVGSSNDLETRTNTHQSSLPFNQSTTSTTSETILLIPPTDEHVENYRRSSWVNRQSSSSAPAMSTDIQSTARSIIRPTGGKSTITKVFTSQTLKHYLPTAEEFFRTTSNPNGWQPNANELKTQSRDTIVATSPATVTLQSSTHKDDMDWYYNSFKKRNPDQLLHKNTPIPAGSSLLSSSFKSPNSSRRFCGNIQTAALPLLLFISFMFVV